MTEVILPIALGLCISIIGFFNMKGNISSIHWYHRKRVKDEDKLIFGKLVGYGNIIIGNSISISGLFNFLAQITIIQYNWNDYVCYWNCFRSCN